MTRAKVMRLSPAGFAAFQASVAQLRAIFRTHGYAICRRCGDDFAVRQGGQPQRYCTSRCRTADERERRKLRQT